MTGGKRRRGIIPGTSRGTRRGNASSRVGALWRRVVPGSVRTPRDWSRGLTLTRAGERGLGPTSVGRSGIVDGKKKGIFLQPRDAWRGRASRGSPKKIELSLGDRADWVRIGIPRPRQPARVSVSP